jgi:hypothetical protein
MRRKQKLVTLLLLLGLLVGGGSSVRADDSAFKAVAKHLKSRYHARKRSIPFLGLANFAVKIVRPAGVKSFKLVTFERLDRGSAVDGAELNALLRSSLSPEWQPLVKVYSRKNGNQTYVYAREDGKCVKLMVVVIDGEEATLVRVKVNPDTLVAWMDKPKILGISLGGPVR